EDGPREAHVQRGRSETAMADVAPIGAEREPAARRVAERLDAGHHATLRLDPDREARGDLADDARDRTVDRLDVLAGRDRPAATVPEDELTGLGADAAAQPV